VTGKGGELQKIGKFQIEPILARHGEPPLEVTRAFNQALRSITTPISPEEAAVAEAIRRFNFDAYLIKRVKIAET
jgi:hypothetical protein